VQGGPLASEKTVWVLGALHHIRLLQTDSEFGGGQ
jgi:hypothetical protein